jgi:hypothetical protein
MHVSFIRCAPGLVSSLECVLRSDDLPFKEGCESWMVFRKPCVWGRESALLDGTLHMRNRWHTLDSEIATEV